MQVGWQLTMGIALFFDPLAPALSWALFVGGRNGPLGALKAAVLQFSVFWLKAGSFARGEGGRARQPGSRLQRTQKGPEPTRLWALKT